MSNFSRDNMITHDNLGQVYLAQCLRCHLDSINDSTVVLLGLHLESR